MIEEEDDDEKCQQCGHPRSAHVEDDYYGTECTEEDCDCTYFLSFQQRLLEECF